MFELSNIWGSGLDAPKIFQICKSELPVEKRCCMSVTAMKSGVVG